MGTVELLQHQEKACWSAYLATSQRADLDQWRKALGRLNDELQHRARLLNEAVRTSAGSYRP